LNVTGKILLGVVIAVGMLQGEFCQAGSGVLWHGVTYALAGQASASPEPTTRPVTRQDVDSLLKQAKQALQQGDLPRADQLVTQAEAANVRYPLFYQGDRPARLRRMVVDAQRDAARRPTDPFLASSGMPRTAGAADSRPNPFVNAPGATPRPLPAVAVAEPLVQQPLAQQPIAQQQTPKEEALGLLAASRAALKLGNVEQAEKFALRASQLNVPESEFEGAADSPARLAWELQRQRYQPTGPAAALAGGPQSSAPMTDAMVQTASAVEPVGDTRYGQQALHVPEQDATANRQASSLVGPDGGPRLAQAPPSPSRYGSAAAASVGGPDLLRQGEEALREGDVTAAWRFFQQADSQRQSLSPVAQARLDSHLKMLANAPAGGEPTPNAVPQPLASTDPAELAPPPSSGSSMFDSADEAQRVLVRQLSSDVGKRTLEARQIREAEPKRALELLQSLGEEVEKSQLADEYRRQLKRRVDLAIADTEKYISDNRAQIELDEKNASVLADVERSRATRLKLQQKKAEMVDQFNRLRDEQRYAEAELIAKQLYEMMPDDEVALLVWQNAKFLRREIMNRRLKNEREEGTFRQYQDVARAGTPNVFDGQEMTYDEKTWDGLQDRRSLTDRSSRLTQREIEIEQKLKMPVQMKYQDRPLSEVIDDLSQMTGVNIHLDPRGMSQEGVSSTTPVTLDLNQEVMLKSALNLILEPLHLSFMIKDEVLKITSEQLRDGEIYPVTYYVADLVTPIPNFVPSNNIGLQGLINDAHAALGYGGGGMGAPGPMSMAGAQRGAAGANPNGNVLAQQLSGPQFGAGPGSSVPLGGGGPSPGGGANADFESLIDLIISTVASETWAENGGGEAEIRRYVNNLSLVVSQTQAVHEEIADLLEQLRRLQDLQISIEVRFIQLNDSFFERIGIDFDVNINDRTTGADDLLDDGANFEGNRGSQTVGIVQAVAGDLPVFSSDLDVPFRQGSFGVAVPQFGGFDPGQAATFGFAILSDIEAYFLVNAAQGDRRSNMLNAPKVTLFNGQTAFVADASQTPFVISVIPVVGEFAAAQQPVIVVLSEGTMMNIQAVVSDDRRYVRLTVVPFFSEIGDVQTFTFEGSSTTNTSSSSTDTDDDGNDEAGDEAQTEVRSGTTVQLPTFQFVSVSTTVSVPDGGTVLLGGIKRLNEGRNEFGVPLLSKLPYINRLFRNVGIGRTTDSLMMMVTPRIIIQEEEEQRLGIGGP